MLKEKVLIALTFLTLAFSLEASNSYDSCMESYDCCPNFDPCCSCYDFTVYGDYLFWKVRRCGLDYAVNFSLINDVSIAENKNLCPEYDSGFRVGSIIDCGDFYFDGRYTFYYSSDNDSIVNLNGTLVGTRSIPSASAVQQANMQYAESDWAIHYHIGDFLFGYHMDVGRCFDLRFFTGFKLAFIEQELNTLYSETTDITGNTNHFDRNKQKVEMDGYGATFGFETAYHLHSCWKLTGGFSYDILLSDFDRRNIFETSDNGGQTISTSQYFSDCWKGVSAFNFSIGMLYETEICGCYNFFFETGYEFHHYLNLVNFYTIETFIAESDFLAIYRREITDLDLDGLFVRFGIEF